MVNQWHYIDLSGGVSPVLTHPPIWSQLGNVTCLNETVHEGNALKFKNRPFKIYMWFDFLQCNSKLIIKLVDNK